VKGQFINGEIWTAGKYDTNVTALKWRSRKSTDFLKRNLYWNKIYGQKVGCVYLELFNDSKSRIDDPRLGLADCDKSKPFICEVKIDF
jgi:hypothetical protein